ncbi:hypothetical protein FACS189449_07030 [Alphaproteobacteria bacterium]|nr:hypothetical protein FACS189449_07030 [Alphaproteobacteria bacterium]
MSEFKNEIQEIKSRILSRYDFLNDKPNKIYIFGSKTMGGKLFHTLNESGYSVGGFIDNDKNRQGTYILGKKVYALDELLDQKEDVVVVVATAFFTNEITRQLIDSGFLKIVPFHVLPLLDEDVYEQHMCFIGVIEHYAANTEKYQKLMDILKDEQSKKILSAIIRFRQLFDLDCYYDIKSDDVLIYFDEMVDCDNNTVFVDGGAYDGYSSTTFIKFSKGNYKKIYLFEPDSLNFAKAKANLAKHSDVEYWQAGLSNPNEILCFDERCSEGSVFCSSGKKQVQCCALDDIVKEDRAFIKLDIEGAELKALQGAERLIRNGSTLAICLYHKAEDVIGIPEYVLSINPNYDIYLRHYSYNIYDAVMYAIPR